MRMTWIARCRKLRIAAAIPLRMTLLPSLQLWLYTCLDEEFLQSSNKL